MSNNFCEIGSLGDTPPDFKNLLGAQKICLEDVEQLPDVRFAVWPTLTPVIAGPKIEHFGDTQQDT